MTDMHVMASDYGPLSSTAGFCAAVWLQLQGLTFDTVREFVKDLHATHPGLNTWPAWQHGGICVDCVKGLAIPYTTGKREAASKATSAHQLLKLLLLVQQRKSY